MTLREKQSIFVKLVAQLITHAYEKGYELTFGEVWRTPEQAALNASKGIGIKNSLHTLRLAVDLNLFKDGKLLTASEDYKPLGEFWESLSTPEYQCCWGGRFKPSPDSDHFSIENEGIR